MNQTLPYEDSWRNCQLRERRRSNTVAVDQVGTWRPRHSSAEMSAPIFFPTRPHRRGFFGRRPRREPRREALSHRFRVALGDATFENMRQRRGTYRANAESHPSGARLGDVVVVSVDEELFRD
jgi:hypothetical protein